MHGMAELCMRDLEIAQSKNVKYRKQLEQTRELLKKSNQRAEEYRHKIELATNSGAEHVKRACDQLDSVQKILSRARTQVGFFEDGLNDPTISSGTVVQENYVRDHLTALRGLLGIEVSE
jgi:hypothetical protein